MTVKKEEKLVEGEDVEVIKTGFIDPTLITGIMQPIGTIAFCTPEGGEMIVIDRDRFLVRGVEVQQGPGEAQQVYEAFVKWMGGVGVLEKTNER